MTLTEFIKHLQTLENEYGDLKVVTTERHEYWGITEDELDVSDICVESAQPKGPKSGESEQCVVLGWS